MKTQSKAQARPAERKKLSGRQGAAGQRLRDLRAMISARGIDAFDRDEIVLVVADALRFLTRPADLPRTGCRRLRSLGLAGVTPDEIRQAAREAEAISTGYLLPGSEAGRRLDVRKAERQGLRLRMFEAVDEDMTERRQLQKDTRREKDRLRAAAKRQAAGAKPRALSDARIRPWEYFGWTDRHWRRKGKPRPPSDWTDSRISDVRNSSADHISVPTVCGRKADMPPAAAPARMTRRSASLRRPATSAGHSSTALAGARSAPRRAPAALEMLFVTIGRATGTGSEAEPARRAGRG